MASHEEGEEARESDESMTTFEPYVAGKVRVSLSMVSYSRDGKQRGGQDFQQRGAAQQVARGQPNQKQSDSSESSGGIGAVFRKIRSTLSTAAGLQQPSPPANTASRTSLTASSASTSGAATKRPAISSSSSGATKQSQQRQQHQRRPVAVGAARNKQPRQQKQINRPPPPATTSSKKAPQLHQHSSAPVLRQPGKGGRTRVRVSPSRSSRATSPPVRGGRQSSSPPIKEGSPLVIDEMASFGPGSGRRNRPPVARLPPAQLTNREQGLSVQSELQHQQRSKSEEPPSSPQWAEPEPPRALDDGFGRALSNARQQQQISSSGDVHQISLTSYSDMHKHRAAAAKIPPMAASSGGVGGEVGGVSSTVGGGRSVAPRPRGGGVKKPLNKQDLLKRIGSIENDEVSKSTSTTVDWREDLVKFLPTPLTLAVWAISVCFFFRRELGVKNDEPHPPLATIQWCKHSICI